MITHPTQTGIHSVNFTWTGDNTTNPGTTSITFTVQSAPITIVRSTIAYLNFEPNPIGVGQTLLVNAWVTPRQFLPGDTFKNFTFTFTNPDGTTSTKGPIESFPDGTVYFSYVPNQVGTWTIQFSFPGDIYNTACQTEKQTLTVQQQPVPGYPVAQPPTGPFTFPVQPNNKEWASLIGPYLQPTGGGGLGYDGTGSRYNPYSQGPRSAHMLWYIPPVTGQAGVIGGQFGELATYAKTSASVNVVIAGRGYYTAGGMIYCVDINTGKQLWTAPGTYLFGAITTPSQFQAQANSAAAISTVPELVNIDANRIIKYDAVSGAVTLNMTSIGGVVSYLGNDGAFAYLLQRTTTADPLWGQYNFIKLDYTGTGTDLPTRIIYNTTSPFNNQDYGVCIDNGVLCLIHFSVYGNSGGIDTATGATLWAKPINYIAAKPEHVGCQNGVMFYVVDGRTWKAVDMKTGNEVWTSEQAYYPWGDFWGYGQADAYGLLYALSYGGVYAFNATTGKIVWFYENSSPYNESPYGVYPYGSTDPIVANGIIYAPESEHSPTFYYKGWNLDAIDAFSGQFLWRIAGEYSVNAIADGILQATNQEDGFAYAFGKGPTATTISTSAQVITQGSSTLLTGTVLDTSAAQNGTAAVADAFMTPWMEYLHMQQPMPTNATGIQVTLSAVDQTGNTVNIGSTTTDLTGAYAMMWTPPNAGTYKITASFAGSDSYFSSSAQTKMGVSVAPTTTQSPAPSLQANTLDSATAMYMAVVAVIIIVIVVVVVALFTRRK